MISQGERRHWTCLCSQIIWDSEALAVEESKLADILDHKVVLLDFLSSVDGAKSKCTMYGDFVDLQLSLHLLACRKRRLHSAAWVMSGECQEFQAPDSVEFVDQPC